MEEVYQSASYQDGYSRPPQPRPRRPVGTSPNHNLHASKSSYLTAPNFGILVAIFVVYLFQRKDGFGRLLSARRERGILNTLMDWLVELYDYIVAYSQMAVELCRNLRLNCLGNALEDWYTQDTNTPSPRNSVSHHSPRGRRRNMAATGANRLTTSRMPELEETDADKLQQQQAAESALKMDNRPLEPSFLRDEDYPPGWLVFHPVLGVVSKVEADKYRFEQEKKRKMELEPQKKSSKQSPQSPRRTPVQKKQPSPAHYKANSKNKSTTPRPLRSAAANVIPNASAMHTPQTIAANG